MKLLVNRLALDAALKLAASVVKERTTKPELACTKLVAKSNILTVFATDMEISIRCPVDQVDISREGSALLPASKLSAVVSSCQDDTVTIEVDGTSAELRTKNGHIKILGYDADEFPPMTSEVSDKAVELPATIWRQALNVTQFIARGAYSAAYAMAGVYVVSRNNQVDIVGVDGKRLGLFRIAQENNLGDSGIVIPNKTVSLISKILDDKESTLRLFRSGENFGVQVLHDGTEGVQIFSLQVTGSFPDYMRMLSGFAHCNKDTLSVNRDLLASAVSAAKLVQNELSDGIKLDISTNNIKISSRGKDIGESSFDVPCVYKDASFSVGYNGKYLLEALQACDTDDITIKFKPNAKSSIYIIDGKNHQHVLMPVLMPVNISE